MGDESGRPMPHTHGYTIYLYPRLCTFSAILAFTHIHPKKKRTTARSSSWQSAIEYRCNVCQYYEHNVHTCM